MTIYSREKKELVIPSSNLELSIVYKEYYLKGYTEGYNEAMDNCKPDYLLREVLNKYYRNRTDFII